MDMQVGRFRLKRINATNVLAALTAIVSVLITAGRRETDAGISLGFIPARIGGGELPADWWAAPAWLTPLTSTLVHFGLLHLLMNMVMLLFAGTSVERLLGWRLTLLLYVVGAYAAAAAQWVESYWLPGGNPVSIMAGASGAVSALVGAYSLLYGRARAAAVGPIPARLVNALWLLVAWTVLNYGVALAFGASGFSLAWAAHVGGFLAGLMLAFPLLQLRFRGA